MKTNPLTSRLRNLYLCFRKHRKLSACFQGGAVSRPHHRLDIRRTEDDGIVGLYAVDGSVVVAVACVVLGVVGEGSGGLAGCNKGEEKQEEEEKE